CTGGSAAGTTLQSPVRMQSPGVPAWARRASASIRGNIPRLSPLPSPDPAHAPCHPPRPPARNHLRGRHPGGTCVRHGAADCHRRKCDGGDAGERGLGSCSRRSVAGRPGVVLHPALHTVEYILRLLSVSRPLRYAGSFYGVVDLLATLPTYLSLLILGAQGLLVIRILRL